MHQASAMAATLLLSPLLLVSLLAFMVSFWVSQVLPECDIWDYDSVLLGIHHGVFLLDKLLIQHRWSLVSNAGFCRSRLPTRHDPPIDLIIFSEPWPTWLSSKSLTKTELLNTQSHRTATICYSKAVLFKHCQNYKLCTRLDSHQ